MVNISEIKLGMTRTQVKEVLGEPTDISIGTRKYPRPCIYKYENTEFHFHYPENGGLWLVGLFENPDEHIVLMKENNV
jgi:hypothetical protein